MNSIILEPVMYTETFQTTVNGKLRKQEYRNMDPEKLWNRPATNSCVL